MALSDVTSRVLVQFKGDVSDLKSKMKDLQGEEKKLAEEQLASMQARNKSIDSQIGMVNKLGAAFAKARELADFASERSRVMGAAGYASIEGLRKASQGLVQEIDLLRFASQARAGALKADNELMEAAQRAMRALTLQGFEFGKVQDKITEALVKGEGEGLKEFGITLRKTTTDQERFAAVKEQIFELAKKAKDATLSEGESMKAASVRYADAIDKIKDSFGRMAVALTPLVNLVATLAEKAARVIEVMTIDSEDFDSWSDDVLKQDRGEMTKEQFNAKWNPKSVAPEVVIVGSSDLPVSRGGIAAQDTYLQELDARLKARAEAEAARRPVVAAGPYRRRQSDYIGEGLLGEGFVEEEYREAAGRYGLDTGDMESRLERAMGEFYKPGGEQSIREGQTKLEKIFGPVSEFDAYAKGFQLLQGAAQTAFSAWIDGSMSAGEAVKKFFAESLKGMASDLLGKAILHGAYAIGSLAFGDFKGATTHGIAAAKAGAGALAIGVLAKALAPGADSASGAASAGGSSGGAGVSPGGGRGGSWGLERERDGSSQVMVVVTGDPFAMDSPRARAANIRRVVGRVVKNGVSAR